MNQYQLTPEELWAKQQIDSRDVDYRFWNNKRASLQKFSQTISSCIFAVDVFKGRYDFASENFSSLFGYPLTWLKTIREQGDLLEERIHPDDRDQITQFQIEHGQFIYSLAPEYRNDYQQHFQFRMLNAKQKYVNVVSRHQVFQQDKQGKAWIILGVLNLSPDQLLTGKVKRTVINRRTGEILPSSPLPLFNQLTVREKEILSLIQKGFLSKEIADQLHVSIYTVHNHRKNILAKLNASNILEALNKVNQPSELF